MNKKVVIAATGVTLIVLGICVLHVPNIYSIYTVAATNVIGILMITVGFVMLLVIFEETINN